MSVFISFYRPNFTGLKSSKLGLLAESKLTPSGGAVQANKQDGGADSAAPKTTFSFAPLSKPVSDENKPPTNSEEKEVDAGEKAEKKIVFGEKLADKVITPEAKKEDAKPKDAGASVFGQNLADRVVNAKDEDGGVEDAEKEKEEKKEFKPSVTSNLFSSAVNQAQGQHFILQSILMY